MQRKRVCWAAAVALGILGCEKGAFPDLVFTKAAESDVADAGVPSKPKARAPSVIDAGLPPAPVVDAGLPIEEPPGDAGGIPPDLSEVLSGALDAGTNLQDLDAGVLAGDGGAASTLEDAGALLEDGGAAQDGGASPDAGGRLVEHIVSPRVVDPTISLAMEEHYVYLDTRVPTVPLLVVALGNTLVIPRDDRPMLQEMASYGPYVIGLRYFNDYIIRTACEMDPDPDCHGKARLEVLEGVDVSPKVEVGPADAIDSRLSKLLRHLSAQFPGEGWEQFLIDSGTDWSKVMLVGRANGGAAAARIAKVRKVNRVVMLNAPFDNQGGVSAAWLREASLTPLDRYYGFFHTGDPSQSQYRIAFSALGLDAFGPPRLVEGAAPPYADKHLLMSTMNTPGPPHDAVSAGASAPLGSDGVSPYRVVWQWMLRPAP